MASTSGLLLAVMGALAVLAASEASPELRLARLLGVSIDSDAVCNNAALSCDGCTTVQQCVDFNGKWKAVRKVACSGKTPYCEAGKCQADLPSSPECTKQTSATFQCTSDGYFPDMASCTKYFLCVGGKAYVGDCSLYPNTVYDQRSAMCVPRSQAQCFSLRCPTPGNSLYQIYTPAPWVYAVCTDSNPANALVGACPEGKAMDDTGKCETACQAAGRSAVAGDTKKYIECVDLGGGKFSKPLEGACPDGTDFDEKTQRCVATPQPQPNP